MRMSWPDYADAQSGLGMRISKLPEDISFLMTEFISRYEP